MSYEFNEEQNKSIHRLSYFMRGVGTVYVVLGLVGLSGSAWILYNLTEMPQEVAGVGGQLWPIQHIVLLQVGASSFFSILAGLSGLLFRRASANLALVVQTQGQDIEHLMSGLSNLRHSFGILYYILLVILLFYTTTIIVPIFLAFAR